MAGAVALGLVLSLASVPQGQSGAYTLISADARRTVPFRVMGGTEMVSLDQLGSVFDLRIAEDVGIGGLTVSARGQRITLLPGQSFASIAGKVISLSGTVQRDRNAWQVPIDFIPRALGPALGLNIEVRRPSRLIVVGDIRVPRVTGRFERQGTGGRLVVEIQPGAPHKVTREGARLVVRFDATALDQGPITGLVQEFVVRTRFDATALLVDLGPSSVVFKADSAADSTRLVIELSPPPPPPPASPTPTAAQGMPGTPIPAPQEPPIVDVGPPGVIRTVVLDPGHGGDDAGARGPGGTTEKDFTLQMARRIKAGIETRMGLRVLLTRDGDEDVPMDRRSALANNNKADVFLSLHANASIRPRVRGVQVLSLSLEDYERFGARIGARGQALPLIGGGTRLVDAVPWELAQMPFAARSASLGSILINQLAERNVPLYAHPSAQAPLRVLVGANMPALLIELGFLSNDTEERALNGSEYSGTLVDAIVSTIALVRNGIPMPAGLGTVR
jgi:N-acetylmuramoyl-L-alanine amidase